MGDLNSSDCSWKKMVKAKANNQRISTVNTDYRKMDITSSSEQVSYIKREQEQADSDDNLEIDETMSLTQDLDPLSLDPSNRKRRRESVPKCESPDERALRLAKMSAYAAQRLANETPDQRANRLRRMSEYAAKRLSQETSEQRAKRLSRMSAYAAKRLANESPEQRQARLARMSAYAARRQAMKKFTGPSTPVNLQASKSNFNIQTMSNQS